MIAWLAASCVGSPASYTENVMMLVMNATVLMITPATEVTFNRFLRVNPMMLRMKPGNVNSHASNATGPAKARANPITAKITLAKPSGFVRPGAPGKVGKFVDMRKWYRPQASNPKNIRLGAITS
jgi:hypothetical protein